MNVLLPKPEIPAFDWLKNCSIMFDVKSSIGCHYVLNLCLETLATPATEVNYTSLVYQDNFLVR